MRFAACKTVSELITTEASWTKFADLMKTWSQEKLVDCLAPILAYQSFSGTDVDARTNRIAFGVQFMTKCACGGDAGLDSTAVASVATSTKFSCTSPLKTLDDFVSNPDEDGAFLKPAASVDGAEIFPATAFDTTKGALLTKMQGLLTDTTRKAAFRAAFDNCDMAFLEDSSVVAHASTQQRSIVPVSIVPSAGASASSMLQWPGRNVAGAAANKVYAWRYVNVAAAGFGAGFVATMWKFGQTTSAADNAGQINRVARWGLGGARRYIEYVYVDNVANMNEAELCMFSFGCTNGAVGAGGGGCPDWNPQWGISTEFWNMAGGFNLFQAATQLCTCAGGAGATGIVAGRARINVAGWFGGNPSVFAHAGAANVIQLAGHNCGALGAYGAMGGGLGGALNGAGL